MNELSHILMDILSELRSINENLSSIDTRLYDVKEGLDNLQGTGLWNTLSDIHDKIKSSTTDICTKMDEIKGTGPWDSISDAYEKLDFFCDKF